MEIKKKENATYTETAIISAVIATANEFTMNQEQLTEILRLHALWLRGEPGGERADLSGADLRRADLSGADLRRANLERADLYDVDLTDADLTDADLRDAYLSCADLRDADLSCAITLCLSRHNLRYLPPWVIIGCQCKTREHWLEYGEEIGERNGYSEEEIAEYITAIERLEVSK